MEVRVSGILHEKTSKSGNNYYCVDVNLTPDYVKTLFLDPADLEVVRLYLENQSLKKGE